MTSTVEKRPGRPKRTAVRASDEADLWLELFAIFIHDIESPLASVRYVLNMIEEGKLDLKRPLHKRIIGSAKTSIKRAESIIHDIMTVARVGRLGLPVSLEPTAVRPIIEEAILLVSASADENRIKIENRCRDLEEVVLADPGLLTRVLDNLLFNAIRHTPEGGTVDVYAEIGDESVFVHVKDSGPGLEDIQPDQLFEKFGQVQSRSKGNHRGVGLGLYFCKLAATGMSGTVMADDHPDGGAVFSVRIPKVKEK